jgi:hypothetical protein
VEIRRKILKANAGASVAAHWENIFVPVIVSVLPGLLQKYRKTEIPSSSNSLSGQFMSFVVGAMSEKEEFPLGSRVFK